MSASTAARPFLVLLCLSSCKDPNSKQRPRTGEGARGEGPPGSQERLGACARIPGGRGGPGALLRRRVRRFPGDGGGRGGALTPGPDGGREAVRTRQPSRTQLRALSDADAPRTCVERGLRALIGARTLRTGAIGEIQGRVRVCLGARERRDGTCKGPGAPGQAGAVHAWPSRSCGAPRTWQGPAARRANLRGILKNSDEAPRSRDSCHLEWEGSDLHLRATASSAERKVGRARLWREQFHAGNGAKCLLPMATAGTLSSTASPHLTALAGRTGPA